VQKNFSNQNLRGKSFKEDLTGANFKNADIRRANFKDANLAKANFTMPKAKKSGNVYSF
jgi:uncharacterized protein YjbI with pentapeptide repeats